MKMIKPQYPPKIIGTDAHGATVFWHRATIDRAGRERQNGHRSGVVWLTGLSGSGKSTLAHAVEERLHTLGVRTYVLDGDNIRHGLCGDLGFSARHRRENMRRAAEVAKLFVDAGMLVLTAFISPFAAERRNARALLPQGDFLEVYCSCPLETCEQRDVKGLYRRARAGEVKQFTGISSPYEAPTDPELVIDTTRMLDVCVSDVMSLLGERGWIRTLPHADFGSVRGRRSKATEACGNSLESQESYADFSNAISSAWRRVDVF